MTTDKIPLDTFINSIIGEGTSFRGDLVVQGLLRIDGDFVGHVETPGRVLIGATGRAKASIRAKEVVVGGTLKGDIFASEKVTILSTGLVIGNIYTPRMTVEDGVQLEGYCCVTPRIQEEGAHPSQPQSTYTLKFKSRDSAESQPYASASS